MPVSVNLATVLPSLRVVVAGARSFAGTLAVKPAVMASKQHNFRAKGRPGRMRGRISNAPCQEDWRRVIHRIDMTDSCHRGEDAWESECDGSGDGMRGGLPALLADALDLPPKPPRRFDRPLMIHVVIKDPGRMSGSEYHHLQGDRAFQIFPVEYRPSAIHESHRHGVPDTIASPAPPIDPHPSSSIARQRPEPRPSPATVPAADRDAAP